MRLEFLVDGTGMDPHVEAGEGSGPVCPNVAGPKDSRGSGREARLRPSGSDADRDPPDRELPAGGACRMLTPLIDTLELFAVTVRSGAPDGLRNSVETAVDDPGRESY